MFLLVLLSSTPPALSPSLAQRICTSLRSTATLCQLALPTLVFSKPHTNTTDPTCDQTPLHECIHACGTEPPKRKVISSSPLFGTKPRSLQKRNRPRVLFDFSIIFCKSIPSPSLPPSITRGKGSPGEHHDIPLNSYRCHTRIRQVG